MLGLLTSLAVGMVLTFERVLANERRSLDRELLEQRENFERDVGERLNIAPQQSRADRVEWAMRRFLETEPDATEVVTIVWAGNERIGSTALTEAMRDIIAAGRFDDLAIGRLGTVHTAAGDLRALRVDVLDGSDRVGTYAVAGPLAPARSEAFEALRRLATAALVSLLVGWLVVEIAVRRVLRPLHRLTTAAAATEMNRFAGAVEVNGDDEVADLTREFNAMITRLDDASAERERLLATISHELRTPLAIARAKLELAELTHRQTTSSGQTRSEHTARAERGPGAPDEVADSLAVARDELERMSRLVGDLLALGRSGRSGFLQRREVHLSSLVRDLELRLDALGFDTVTVAPPPDVVVVVDAERILQALLNCVQNGIVHNPPGTTVDMGISIVSDRLVIRVVDDGTGIPPEHRADVLEPFVWLDRGTGHESHSSGLGLAVVAAIADAHGGVVRILDAPVGAHVPAGGTGTMVEMSFPVDWSMSDDARHPSA